MVFRFIKFIKKFHTGFEAEHVDLIIIGTFGATGLKIFCLGQRLLLLFQKALLRLLPLRLITNGKNVNSLLAINNL
jgi:hypothetical protein